MVPLHTDKESNRLKAWLVTSTKMPNANVAAMLLHLKYAEDLLHVDEHRLHRVCHPKTTPGSAGRAFQEKRTTTILYFEKHR